jgi:hypothetical protein
VAIDELCSNGGLNLFFGNIVVVPCFPSRKNEIYEKGKLSICKKKLLFNRITTIKNNKVLTGHSICERDWERLLWLTVGD